jgi:hypothetical protein
MYPPQAIDHGTGPAVLVIEHVWLQLGRATA